MREMATNIAKKGLLLFFLFAIIVSAKARKCHSCIGSQLECKSTEVTCPGSNDTCGSSFMVVESFLVKEHTVTKGCVSSTEPYRSISLSPNELVQLSIEEKTCNTDLCNTETITVSKLPKNNKNCYACISPEKDCTSETLGNLDCRGQQNSCLDIRVLGNAGDISNSHIKGCGEMNCSGDMRFHSTRLSVILNCCNENFCNSDLEFKAPDQTPNGVECYNCNTLSGDDCTPGNISKTQCYGSLTHCFESTGVRMKDGKPKPALLMGCATPNMCDSLVLPLLQKLKGSRVRCCNGSLCNNHFIQDQASSYFTGSAGNMNGHGNSSSSSGYHVGENRDNSSTALSGSHRPGEHSNTMNYNSIFNGSDINPNITSEGGLHSNYNPNMLPPVVNGPPQEYFYGNGYDNNSNIHGTEVNNYGNNYIPPGGNSHGGYNDSQNNNSGTFGISYPNMPPPVPGHISNSGYNILNGSNSYGLPPGFNLSSNGNNSVLINMLSNATGLSPTLLSERFNGADLSKPGIIVSLLSGTPGFNTSRLSPELKAALFGNSSTYSNGPGFNYNLSTPQWNSSSFGNRDKLIAALSAATGISPSILFQKLHGVDISNPRNLASVLPTIQGFNANRLPPELKAAIFGYSSNVNPIFSNTDGYNNNILTPKPNISHLVNNSNFLNALSNMTNISTTVLSQRLNELNKGNQSNLPALLLSLPGFDPNKLSPEFKADIFGTGTDPNYSNTGGLNYNMAPPGSSSANLDNLIHRLSAATGISPTLLSQKLHGVDISNPRNLASVLPTIQGFDANRLTPELKAAIFGNSSTVNPIFSNTDGYNNNVPSPKPNISHLVNNSNFLNALSNMTNISTTVLSQRLNELNKGNQSNLPALLLGLPGFDPNKLSPEFKADIFGTGTDPNYYNTGGLNYNMAPPGSSSANLDNLIQRLSAATGISPTLLSQKLHGVDISNPRNLASVLATIPGFDANRLTPELKAAIFGYSSNVNPIFSNTDGYNNNVLTPKLNISHLVTNSNFLEALSNMTNISTTVLSQRLNELNMGNQSNLPALLFSLPGFDPYMLSPDFEADIFGTGTDSNYSNTGGLNYNMAPPGSSSANVDNLIQRLSAATGISPTLLSQKLHGVDISNPRNLASVLPTIQGFDANRLTPELKDAIFGYNSNLHNNIPNISGYNNNMVPPTLNISNLINNTNFLNAVSNMTNMSTTELSQKLKEWDKDNQKNLPALLLSLHGFDPQRLSPELRAGIFGMNSNTTMPPGSHFGNSWSNGTYNTDLSLSGKNTNDSSTDSNSNNNSAYSLESKTSFLAIIFMITLLLVN